MEDDDPAETPRDEVNPEIEVHPTAGRNFGDDPDYNEFWDLIYNLWQPFYCAEDFKLAIRFVEAHYPKSQIDRRFNEGGWKITDHFSYNSSWTMNNQIYAMDNQLLKWWEAYIATPNGWRIFHSRDPVDCVWYPLRQRPEKITWSIHQPRSLMRRGIGCIPGSVWQTGSGRRRIDFHRGQQLFHWSVDRTRLTSQTSPATRKPDQTTWPLWVCVLLYGTNTATLCTLSLPSSRCRPNSNGIPLPMSEPREIHTSRCCVILRR